MCVICYKKKEQSLPSNETIQDMWVTNPHGAGIMWKDGDKVRFKKGFMKLEDFMSFVNKNRKRLADTEVAMHFRITTHGGTNKENTHPFVVNGKGKSLRSGVQKGWGTEVLMHNGILPFEPRVETISDTAEFALRLREIGGSAASTVQNLGAIEGNRLLVFTATETVMTGDWKTDSDGLTYSNLNHSYGEWWKKYQYTPVKSNKIGFNSYGDLADRDDDLYDYDCQWWDEALGWQDMNYGTIDFEDVVYAYLEDEFSRAEYRRQEELAKWGIKEEVNCNKKVCCM